MTTRSSLRTRAPLWWFASSAPALVLLAWSLSDVPGVVLAVVGTLALLVPVALGWRAMERLRPTPGGVTNLLAVVGGWIVAPMVIALAGQAAGFTLDLTGWALGYFTLALALSMCLQGVPLPALDIRAVGGLLKGNVRRLAVVVVALMMVGAAWLISIMSAAQVGQEGTQVAFSLDHRVPVDVTVANHEGHSVDYSVSISGTATDAQLADSEVARIPLPSASSASVTVEWPKGQRSLRWTAP